jgi:urease accessory protein
LSPSNLPTGGFIASSGLESYIQHGLLASDGAENKAAGVLHFLRKSLHAYARLSLPFLSSAHLLLLALPASSSADPNDDLAATQNAFDRLLQLDHQFETMSLNHIARRASTAQGIALLTLYERALAPEVEAEGKGPRQLLVERLRKAVRAGEALGHLPVGFAAMAGACGLSLGEFVRFYSAVGLR